MEIELDLRGEQQAIWYAVTLGMLVLILAGLAMLGRPVTPYTAANAPRTLTWQDWRLLQAEKVYLRELTGLRSDAEQLIDAVNSNPNPVAVQLLADRILRHAADGVPALESARYALAQAAVGVRDWAAGALDRDAALAALQTAIALLQ